MNEGYFVYVLRSLSDPSKTYVGFTTRLELRLEEHNDGSQIYTRRHAPWERIANIALTDRQKALDLEKYLQSPSGKAFIAKRLSS